MIRQRIFDFHQQESLDWNDFIESDENREFLEYLKRWSISSSNGVIVYGASGVGKTHMAALWAQSANAVYILDGCERYDPRDMFDNSCNFVLDNFDEFLKSNCYEWLFHFLNILKEKNRFLLIVARTAPKGWFIPLADLHSRLMRLPAFFIRSPGDELLHKIIQKIAKDIGIAVPANSIKYLLTTVTRDVYTIKSIVLMLNKLSLEFKQPITVPFIKKHLHLQ